MKFADIPSKLCNCFILVFIVANFLSCGPKETVSATKPIRFAYQNRIGSAIPIIAVEKGYFKKQGLVVKAFRFNSGPACAEALYSGSADIGTMGDASAIFMTAQHTDLKIIASHCTGEHRHRIIVKDASPYQTLGDLVGKQIGIKKGTSTHGGLLVALAQGNIPQSALKMVDLNPGTMPAALLAGSIDAFAASEPTPSLCELKGGRELITLGGLGNQYPIMILTHTAFLTNREKELRRFFKALGEAEAFVRDNCDETVKILKKTTGLPLDVTRRAMKRHAYRLTLDETIIDSLVATAKFLQTQNKIKRLPDLSTSITSRFLTRRTDAANLKTSVYKMPLPP